MSDAEKIQALLDLLAEAEILLHTAPILGSSQYVGRDVWHAWHNQETAWQNKLAKTLIVDMSKEQVK